MPTSNFHKIIIIDAIVILLLDTFCMVRFAVILRRARLESCARVSYIYAHLVGKIEWNFFLILQGCVKMRSMVLVMSDIWTENKENLSRKSIAFDLSHFSIGSTIYSSVLYIKSINFVNQFLILNFAVSCSYRNLFFSKFL